MNHTRQLFVVRRGLDPTVWTALHTLRETHPEWAVEAVARAELWEFDAASAARGAERGAALERWVQSANWFANPTRDRLLWRHLGEAPPPLAAHAVHEDGRVGASSPGGHLLVVWREGLEATEHTTLARQALAESVTIRRGTVWWLASGDDPSRIAAAGESAGGGLLANPESQWSRWLGAALPIPLLGHATELLGAAAKGAS